MIPINTKGRQKPKGWFAIGIENLVSEENLGTLWRTAVLMGASYIFTIGKKYKLQASDTKITHKNIPLHQYDCLETFLGSYPKDAKLVGIEIDDRATSIVDYEHFDRTVYLLGSEGNGLSKMAMESCHDLLYIPSTGCLNVAVTGSIVLYDRVSKQLKTS
jgi:tRNA G18 (ribose-2'-O)-methylase SpoU